MHSTGAYANSLALARGREREGQVGGKRVIVVVIVAATLARRHPDIQ